MDLLRRSCELVVLRGEGDRWCWAVGSEFQEAIRPGGLWLMRIILPVVRVPSLIAVFALTARDWSERGPSLLVSFVWLQAAAAALLMVVGLARWAGRNPPNWGAFRASMLILIAVECLALFLLVLLGGAEWVFVERAHLTQGIFFLFPAMMGATMAGVRPFPGQHR